jgi:hypothetical protein
MIQPTYVTYTQAAWLKDKGFDERVNSYYINRDEYDEKNPIKRVTENGLLCDIKRPEQWLVIEWLRVNHGIWINIDWMPRIIPYNSGYYCHLRGITKKLNQDNFIPINETLELGYEIFNSPQEAYSAAFDYIISNNLI